MAQQGHRKPYLIRAFRVECTDLDRFNKANDEIETWMESVAADGYSLVSITDVPGHAGFVHSRVIMKLTESPSTGFRVH